MKVDLCPKCGVNREVVTNCQCCYFANRPPLGLKPKFIHDEQRAIEIAEAIERYLNVGKNIPQDWIDEYNELTKAK